jgi:hypothetical protein
LYVISPVVSADFLNFFQVFFNIRIFGQTLSITIHLFTFLLYVSKKIRLFLLQSNMRRPVIKYLIALTLLVIFSGGLSMTVFPGLLKGSSSSSWQKQESENDASRTENTKGIEIREFEAEVASADAPRPSSEIVSSQYGTADFSFVRTFYLLVPTPPPDRLG